MTETGLLAALDPILLGVPQERRRLEPGQALFHQGDIGDSAQVIRNGMVALEVPVARDPMVVEVYGPGGVVGANRLLDPGSRHETTARALVLTDVQLVRWSRINSGEHRCQLQQALAIHVAREQAMCIQRMLELARLPAAGRVAAALRRLGDCDGDCVIGVGCEVIAAVAAVSRAAAVAELRSLADRGVVELGRRKVIVLDRDALDRWAQGSGNS